MLKYFLLGVFGSAFFLFGVALLYGYAGISSYVGVAQAIIIDESPPVLLSVGLVMSVAGLLFKVGVVPFHTWAPDVYIGASTPVTGFMVIATKTAAVAVLLRVFYVALDGVRWNWQPITATAAVAIMVVGVVVGLMQQDIKRLLAYSSIAYVGFILAGFVAAADATAKGGVSSVGSIFFYLLAYGFATLGGFGIIIMAWCAGGEANGIAAWRGLGRTSLFVTGVMTLFLLSSAGILLTAGFVGKLVVFAVARQGGYGRLVLAAVIANLVAAFLYLKVVVVMWSKEPERGQQGRVAGASEWTWIVAAVSAVATIVLGLVPGSILDLAAGAAQFIR